MSYCINPLCTHRQNPDGVESCLSCGTPLVINDRIRLLTPLRPLTENPYVYFDVFEVEDAGTKWHPVREKRIMKILKWNTPDLVKLIERESQTLQMIRHPKIPRSSLHDYFTFVPSNGLVTLHCLLMDKLEGQNLEDWVEENGRISQSLALDWLKQLVEILDTVHGCNFFHRDIKPANIILRPNGELALIDFGSARRVTDTYLAKVSGSGGTDTGRGGLYEITAFISTRYSPLEQINGQAVPQSDFYALGRTFVRLITGTSLMRLPIDEKSGSIIWRDKAPQIDKPFADLLDNLMAPFPGQRPMTTKVISQRLEKLPRQSQIHKIISSKKFILGLVVSTVTLLGLGIYKIALPALANNLIIEGQNLEAANNSQGAQKLFDSAININPEVRNYIAKLYFDKAARSTKNLKDARRYYSLSIKYNNQDVDAYTNLAFACQLLKDYECATSNYSKALQLKPTLEGYFGLGTLYDDMGEQELAEQQYNLALEINKQTAQVLNNLSRLKNLKGEYDEAIALAEKGLKTTQMPELQAALYKNLGWAKLKQKKIKEAQRYLEKAENLDIQRADTHCLKAQVYDILGDRDNAFLSWEACLTLNSEQPEVFGWRDDLLQRIIKKNR